jgi:hypothetical protein
MIPLVFQLCLTASNSSLPQQMPISVTVFADIECDRLMFAIVETKCDMHHVAPNLPSRPLSALWFLMGFAFPCLRLGSI